jgi:hypothetical protein
MKLDETLARAGFLPLGGSGATLPAPQVGRSVDGATASLLPAPQVGRSVDGATASLYRGLMKFWVRLYAPAPRRLSPLV